MLTKMHPAVALPYERARRATLRRTHLHEDRERPRTSPMRRWVGRQLVRTGAWLANDPTPRPVRAR